MCLCDRIFIGRLTSDERGWHTQVDVPASTALTKLPRVQALATDSLLLQWVHAIAGKNGCPLILLHQNSGVVAQVFD
jgi:hypothetical protein